MRQPAQGVWQLPGWGHLVNCYLVRGDAGTRRVLPTDLTRLERLAARIGV